MGEWCPDTEVNDTQCVLLWSPQAGVTGCVHGMGSRRGSTQISPSQLSEWAGEDADIEPCDVLSGCP